MMMIAVSLFANVAVTFAVTFALWRNQNGTAEAFGPNTPARRILGCLYFTIGVFSLGTLVLFLLGQMYMVFAVVMVLLPFQIVYKLLTVLVLGVGHPVVIANLCIVALHTLTLITLI